MAANLLKILQKKGAKNPTVTCIEPEVLMTVPGPYHGWNCKDVPAAYLDELDGYEWIADHPLVSEYIRTHRNQINEDLSDR